MRRIKNFQIFAYHVNFIFNMVNLSNIVIPENFVADAEKFIRNPGVGDMNMNYS